MKKMILALLLGAAGAYAQPTLTAVSPGPFVGTNTFFTYTVSNPLPASSSSQVYYYFAMVPVGTTPVNQHTPPGSCVEIVTVQPTEFSIVQVSSDAGDDLTNWPTPPGAPFTPVDTGFYQDGSPVVSNSQCSAGGFGLGSNETLQGNTLNIGLATSLNPNVSTGVYQMWFGYRPNIGPGPIWSGPFRNPDGSAMLFVAGSLANAIGTGTGIHPYPGPPVDDYAPNCAAGLPCVAAVTPINGSGLPPWFTVTAIDPNGFQDIWAMYLIFGSPYSSAPRCFMSYIPSQSSLTFYLESDQQGSWLGPYVGTAVYAHNSQCQVGDFYISTFFGSPADQQLQAHYNVGFYPAFFSQQQVWAAVTNMAGGSSGWQYMGTWTP